MFRDLKAHESIWLLCVHSWTTEFIHCDVTLYICLHAIYCCQNHLVANCFTHNLLSLKRLSQRRQDDDTLGKPRARTSVSCPPISVHSCQKCWEDLPVKCFIAADNQIEMCDASHSEFYILDWCQQETGLISCTVLKLSRNICNSQYICNLKRTITDSSRHDYMQSLPINSSFK